MRLITLFLPQLPLLTVWLVGMLVAFLNLRRHPRVSALVLIALFLLIGQSVFGTLIIYMSTRPTAPGLSIAEVGSFMTAVSVVRAGLSAVAWGLILVALFSGRPYHAPYVLDEEPLPVRRREPRPPVVDAPPAAFREQPPSP
jgi:hypothetical protein